MYIIFGIVLLAFIYLLWKLFIDGWLFKIILFFGGWFGIYVFCRMHLEGATKVGITIGVDNPISFTWAAVVPTVICFLVLLFTKVHND